MLPVNKIKLNLEDGILEDIFMAERSYYIGYQIGKHSEIINQNREYRHLFGAIQGAAHRDCLMAIARIFDKPSKKYPTLCLISFLDYLEENRSSLPEISESTNLIQSLKYAGIDVTSLNSTKDNSDNELSQYLIASFRTQLNSPKVQASIELLRNLRDKWLAHNEQVEKLEGPSWNSVLDLLELPKHFVICLGWAYLSTGYGYEGEFTLSKDAKKPSYYLINLFERILHN